MTHSTRTAPVSGTDTTKTAEAIRAWHRGDTLTAEQLDLIDASRRQCLARAHGVEI